MVLRSGLLDGKKIAPKKKSVRILPKDCIDAADRRRLVAKGHKCKYSDCVLPRDEVENDDTEDEMEIEAEFLGIRGFTDDGGHLECN